MNKLFVFQENSDADYSRELESGFSVLSARSDSLLRADISRLNADFLNKHKIDVVVSNGLPPQSYAELRKLKIATVTMDSLGRYHDQADIVIDHKDAESNRYFTGPEYSLQNNGGFGNEFSEIADLIKKLEWDSGFWGFPVAFLSCRNLTESIIHRTEKFAASNNIKLIEYLCNCHDNRSVKIASTNNFCFTDIRLTFEKDIKGECDISLDGNMRFGLAGKEDTGILKEIAGDIYVSSRYYFDPGFDKTKASEFFQLWVEKAVLGKYDDECNCLYIDDKPAGFCTIKYLSQGIAKIGLFGIDNSCRGRGLAMKLLSLCINRLADKNISKLLVVTQGRNYAAQRLYQRAGFLTKATELWYHKWL